jgi:hypothetical protein
MWMDDKEVVKKVKYSFYEKPMAAKDTVLKESALSLRVKKMACQGKSAGGTSTAARTL